MKNGLFTTEAFDIIIPIRSYDEYHGITLCSVILNEEKYIKDFLEYYKPYVKSIVIIDGGSSDRTVEIATPIADRIRIRKFDGHYSNQANRAVEMAETDWILLMDCDERLEKPALEHLNNMINQEEADCWAFPRKNFIDGMLQSSGPTDYQERLYRSYCRRIRPVHGEVVGYKKCKKLPEEDGNYIIHSKGLQRHIDRNKGYLLYELKYKHEMGEPGAQTKKNFEDKYPMLGEGKFIIR